MKTFWKVLLFILVGLVCLRFLPVLLIPMVLGLLAMFAIGALLLGGLATVAATGISVIGGTLVVVLVLLAALSPIWVPVLAIVGLVSLFRRGNRPGPQPPVVA